LTVMARHKIGLVLESLNLPFRNALRLAGTLGVDGVQVDAVGDLAPDQLSTTGRKEVRHLLRSFGLELAAVGCPLRHGLHEAAHLEGRLARVQKTQTLAYDLGARIVVTWPGSLPQADAPARTIFTDSLTQLGRHGDCVGVTLALAAGADPPAEFSAYLRTFTCGGLGVQIDPATLLLRRLDPPQVVTMFADQIVYVHARDGVPERPDRLFEEVPLGHGEVDWVAFLGALEEVAYHGWLTLRRGPCADPAGDLKAGASLLRRLGA